MAHRVYLGYIAMPRTFARYLALGDSISIDLYPALDAARRYQGKGGGGRLGAASLFFSNDNEMWPEFRGRDLTGLCPEIAFDSADDLTADGATTHSLLRQVASLESSDERCVITITAGGNDLLSHIGYRPNEVSASPVSEIGSRLRESIAQLFERRPSAIILLSTVYDPSDGSARLPGIPRSLEREAGWLDEYNTLIRDLCHNDGRLLLADIHTHFLGHGLSAPAKDQWYLEESIIEPNARGASEVRRVWLESLAL